MNGFKVIMAKYYQWIAFVLFLIFIFSISGSELVRVVDPLSLIVLVIGTFLLTVMTLKKRMSKIELYNLLIRNTIVIGIIIFLIGFIISLSFGSEFTELIKMISVSLIVLVYALIIVSILKFLIVIEEGKSHGEPQGNIKNDSNDILLKNISDVNIFTDNNPIEHDDKVNISTIGLNEDQNLLEHFFMNYDLTAREKKIIEMGLKGSTNKDIADQLFVSESTIKKQTTLLYKKVNVKSRYELIALYSNIKISNNIKSIPK